MLAKVIEGCGSRWGCWTILPPQTREVITAGFFEQMAMQRVVALRAFPDLHRFQLRKSVFGGFLDELAARRIPLMLQIEGNIPWPTVYDLLEEVPNLTCVLCDIGIAGVDRQMWPLLERYPNVYVDSSLLSLGEGAMEAMVGEFSSRRILFGTGFPARYAEAAALQLLHADISDSDKANIAGANLRRLISEVSP
jgi:predicted TIM-barrel fold metal-dependent hydrolase